MQRSPELKCAIQESSRSGGGGSLARYLLLSSLFACCPSGYACEPVFPLVQIFAGAFALSFLGGLAILLPIAVAVKCLVFARLEKNLSWGEAVWLMFVANLYSSLMGILAALSGIVPLLALLSPVIIYFASLVPARRILNHVNWAGPRTTMTKESLALLFTFIFLATIYLFFLGPDPFSTRGYTMYWIWKLSYVTLALALSMLLTTSWEESMIARLAAKRHAESSYLVSVARANYATFGVLLLIAAAVALPARLKSPGFLYQGP